MYPLMTRKDNLSFVAFDFAESAVEMAKTHELYDPKKIELNCLDLVKDDLPESYHGCDYAILMFVLSAISPELHVVAIKKIYAVLA